VRYPQSASEHPHCSSDKENEETNVKYSNDDVCWLVGAGITTHTSSRPLFRNPRVTVLHPTEAAPLIVTNPNGFISDVRCCFIATSTVHAELPKPKRYG
jgi:hypothetical protein